MHTIRNVLISFLILVSPIVFAAGNVEVGRKAASKYFQADVAPSKSVATADGVSSSGDEQLFSIHLGAFSSSDSYNWKGGQRRSGVGTGNYGFTYLFSNWDDAADTGLRVDFIEYKLDETSARKLSLLPLVTFPRAEKNFPIYLGLGVGAGVFFTQVEQESSLSLDYQILIGARWLDIVDNLGAFLEYGMKNHLHLLSDGQFNGTYLAAGCTFSF